MVEFQKFPKIARLNRNITITEKIDGTNACVLVDEDGTVRAASRNRLITPEDDNFKFAAWVAENASELVGLGPGRHYGEWWGQGIQRGYELDHRRFSLFNVNRWEQTRVMTPVPEFPDSTPLLPRAPSCCHVVPILSEGTILDSLHVSTVLRKLDAFGSVAAPDYDYPEGVVIHHTAANILFKVTIDNDEQPKGK